MGGQAVAEEAVAAMSVTAVSYGQTRTTMSRERAGREKVRLG